MKRPPSSASSRATGSRKRLRRPFGGSPRAPTRAELRALVCRVYGPRLPSYFGSPFEGTRNDAFELVMHELAHFAQLPAVKFVPGRGERASDVAFDLLVKKGNVLADRHEVRAIAVTLMVARALRLPLERRSLVVSGARNSQLLNGFGPRPRINREDDFERLVALATRTPAVRRATQTILDLLDREWASGGY